MKTTPTLTLTIAASLTLAALAAPRAFADGVERRAAPSALRTAISVQLATLDRTGGSLEAERATGWRKTSIALSLGARSAARGDFDSRTAGAGLELRRWLRRSTAMRGWYVAASTDLSRTTIDDALDGRRVGAMTTWSLGASTGYRFVLWRHLELTPSLGLATVIESGTMSPATTRGAGILGLTAGAVF
jgi:hypothetical protein